MYNIIYLFIYAWKMYTPYLVLLVEVCPLHFLHIQLERAGNMVHHALSDEDAG